MAHHAEAGVADAVAVVKCGMLAFMLLVIRQASKAAVSCNVELARRLAQRRAVGELAVDNLPAASACKAGHRVLDAVDVIVMRVECARREDA